MKKLLILLVFLAVLLGIAGIFYGSVRWIKTYNHVLYIANLPQHLEGLRILHLSDLHSNHPQRMNLDIWRHIDNLDFDIAVITGDIVLDPRYTTYTLTEMLAPHRDGFARLASRVPTFFVEGNHESDYFAEVSRFMNEIGINFLFNDSFILAFGGGHLEIIGTADYSTLNRHQRHNADFIDIFNNIGDGFQIVLTHQPQIFNRVKDSGINLMFAGHTHGGQLRLPFFPTFYAPGQGFFPQYGEGFYRHNDAVLYVSRGLGTTYFPFRFWNRPEIAVIELRGS